MQRSTSTPKSVRKRSRWTRNYSCKYPVTKKVSCVLSAMDGIRRLSLGNSRRRMSDFTDIQYLADATDGIQLSNKQKKLIREAWRIACKKGANNVGKKIFFLALTNQPDLRLRSLFKISDSVSDKKLCDQPNFQAHAQIFTDVLGLVVESLDALDDSLGPLLVSYGNKHVEFESESHTIFTSEYWDCFAEAMCEVATGWKIKNDRIETLQTWRILVFFIVNKVREGYDWQKKQLRFRSKTKSLDSIDNLVP